jgi:hypothetical protein
MNSLHAELAARPQSRADFAWLAAGWLTDARRRLFPDLDPGPGPRCRAVLRGYSRVTICAAELAIRLGGASALAASGAFDEVRELPGGRVHLRATAAVEDLEGAAVRRAFEALAPVLLPGRPDPERLSGMPARLVRDCDAGDFR